VSNGNIELSCEGCTCNPCNYFKYNNSIVWFSCAPNPQFLRFIQFIVLATNSCTTVCPLVFFLHNCFNDIVRNRVIDSLYVRDLIVCNPIIKIVICVHIA